MKLVTLLLFVSIMQVSAATFAQNVDVNVKNASLKDVFKIITKQSNYEFIYDSQMLQNTKTVSLTAKNKPLREVLKQCFDNQPVDFFIQSNTIIVTPRDKNAELQQQLQVSGIVVSADDNQPLPGVFVKIKNAEATTVTNQDGKFSLKASIGQVLVFSFLGFQTQEITINNTDPIQVKLKVSVTALSDVVVVGYGTRSKESLSGAVTEVKAEQITNQPIISIDQGLAGLVPGVTFREGTGAPGAGPEILIRGINTFGNNKPLIVIDDVIFEDGNDQNNNPLALINPEDIESVVVLKDAATKAIYGSRATAGVVIVTTKRGKAGKPVISFNSNFGISDILEFEKPDVLNAQELAQFFKEKEIDRIRATNATYADPSIPVPDNVLPASAANYLNPSSYGVGTNWFDLVTQQAATQSHNISVSGGNDNVKFYVSGNFLDQEGTVKGNDFQRYAIRANVDVKISNRIKYGISLNPSRTLRDRPADDPSASQFSVYSTITSTYWADPSASVYDANGMFNYTTQGRLTSNWTANPLYQLDVEIEKRLNNQLLLGNFLEFEILKNFKFKTNLSYNYSQNRSQNFQPSTLVGDGSLTPVFPNINGGRATLFNQSTNNIISDNLLTYNFTKKGHTVDFLAGFNVQKITGENSSIFAQRIIDENFRLPDFNNVDPASRDNFRGSEEYGESRLISYISRVNYNYKGKYLLNASLRRDGSSRFGRDVQYGNFPAGSIAWRVSDENFMKNIKGNWLNDLRVEVGYGVTGNNKISNYGHLGQIAASNYIFGGVNSLGNSIGTLPNSSVTWEESKQFDIGLNASFLKNRANLSLNFYRQTTDGLLATIPISWITGFGGVVGNSSVMRNDGFEVQLDVVAIKTDKLTWSTSFNASKYKNKILELANGTFFSGNSGNGTGIAISQEGQPVGMYRGLRITGLFTAAEIADPNVPKYTGAREGSLKWADINGNGQLDIEADYDIIGNPHPDLMFGWNNQLSYKKFNLRTIFAGQLGGKIYDLRREIMWNVDGNFNIDRQMLDRFRPGDDPASKTFPTTVSLAGNTTRYVRFPSTNKMYDGSYLALKNITLGYNFTSLINQRTRLFNSVEMYVSMRNAFYIAAYKYGNPEVRRSNDGSAVRSVNYGSYPISRTLTFGLNISL